MHEGGYWLWCETSSRRLRTRSLESESCWIAATLFTSVGSRGARTGTRTYVLQVTFIVETLSKIVRGFDADDWLLQDFLFPGASNEVYL